MLGKIYSCHVNVNDPLGQLTARPADLFSLILKSGDGRTPSVNIVIAKGHVWVGQVDQQDKSHQ